MNSAVSARATEIATLRAIGFGPGAVVISVLAEAPRSWRVQRYPARLGRSCRLPSRCGTPEALPAPLRERGRQAGHGRRN
jgi:hypothetical protein